MSAESHATLLRCANATLALLAQSQSVNQGDDELLRDALGWVASQINQHLDDLEGALAAIGGHDHR